MCFTSKKTKETVYRHTTQLYLITKYLKAIIKMREELGCVSKSCIHIDTEWCLEIKMTRDEKFAWSTVSSQERVGDKVGDIDTDSFKLIRKRYSIILCAASESSVLPTSTQRGLGETHTHARTHTHAHTDSHKHTHRFTKPHTQIHIHVHTLITDQSNTSFGCKQKPKKAWLCFKSLPFSTVHTAYMCTKSQTGMSLCVTSYLISCFNVD